MNLTPRKLGRVMQQEEGAMAMKTVRAEESDGQLDSSPIGVKAAAHRGPHPTLQWVQLLIRLNLM